MAFAACDIIQAFIEYECAEGDLEKEDGNAEGGQATQRRYATFGLRCPNGPGGGYVRVWGPNADPHRPSASHVVIELYNGAVRVRDSSLARHLAVVPYNSAANITHDPIGYSCAPNAGCFASTIHPNDMGPGKRYATPKALVAAILGAFEQGGTTW